jgi:hypothetical protein
MSKLKLLGFKLKPIPWGYKHEQALAEFCHEVGPGRAPVVVHCDMAHAMHIAVLPKKRGGCVSLFDTQSAKQGIPDLNIRYKWR